MRSISYRIWEMVIKYSGVKKLCQLDSEEFKKLIDKKYSNQKYEPSKKIKKKYTVEEIVVSNSVCYKIKSKTEDSSKEIFFIHGGGYVLEISGFHWNVISKLIDRLKVTVYVPIYPLTPTYTYKETLTMMEELYKIVINSSKNNQIYFMGDSAGAQISLSFCMYLRNKGIKQPQKLLLLSPLITFSPDLAMLQKMKDIEKKDCMLSVNLLNNVSKFWTKGTDLTNYIVSPLNGEFEDLTNLYIFSGTHDILYPQANKLIEKAKEAGVKVKYFEGKEMMHTWAYMFFSTECKKAFIKMIEFLDE